MILLDRDGVINELRDRYVVSIKDFAFEPGSNKALKILAERFGQISVCSNQRGVALGMVTQDTLRQIESKIAYAVPRDFNNLNFYYCEHNLDEGCTCRKPLPGLLEQAIKDTTVKREETIFVGDSVSDYMAAMNAGLEFALVLTGHGKISSPNIPNSIPRFNNLLEFAQSKI